MLVSVLLPIALACAPDRFDARTVGPMTLPAAASAAQTAPPEPSPGPGVDSRNFAFESKLKTLVVFREGFGFFVREGAARLENGWATTNLVPTATRGSFAVYPTNPADRIDTIVVTPDHQLKFGSPAELRRVLSDKIGLNLSLTLQSPSSREPVARRGRLSNLLDNLMLLRDEQGQFVAIEYSAVKTASLVDFPIRIKLATRNPNGRAALRMHYIQRGVAWEPTYQLEILSPQRGRLTLRGTLLQLSEELDDAEVVFVVGAPVLSESALLDRLLAGIESGLAKSGLSFAAADADNQIRLRNAQAPGAARGGGGGGGLGAASDVLESVSTGESGELTYYSKKGFSLRPGERALTTIFEIEVPIAPLFDWNADQGEPSYMLRLTNSTRQPFTTGPVFVSQNSRPVGQQNMNYTAPGATAELKLASGLGLRGERREVEAGPATTETIGNRAYRKVPLKGVLTLTNSRDEEADVRVRRTVLGRVGTVGNDGVVKSTTVQRNDPNSVNLLEWRVKVPAGRALELTYTYDTLVPLPPATGPESRAGQ
ncbi:MAG: hypothetical protein SNJ74_07195 [Fimbriimonadaceae bacterium]